MKMKRNKAIIYTIVFLLIISIAIALLSNKSTEKSTETKEQLLNFNNKISYTFTKTDETISFLIDKKNNYLLTFDAKVENAPVILDIKYNDNLNNVTINNNGKYNLTLNSLNNLLEIRLKNSKATPNIENINLKDVQGNHLHKDTEKIAFYHDIDNAFFNKNLKKLNYSIEFKIKGEDDQTPIKARFYYGTKYKDVVINETNKIKNYNMIMLDLGTLEGNQTFKFEPKVLSVKIGDTKHYQTIYIKDIKLIKPTADKKITLSNIKIKKI